VVVLTEFSRQMADMDEEALISRVLSLRAASTEPLTAAQLHAALTDEGLELEFSAVKKAASKAAKRAPETMAASASPAPETGPPTTSKKAEKAAKATAEALKAAETLMLNTQKRLQNRHLLNAAGGTLPTDKAFIERAALRAITGSLDAGETVSRERVEADMAMLEWLLHPGNPSDIAQEQKLAAVAQLEMLKAQNSKR
jgi:hypothetical protein